MTTQLAAKSIRDTRSSAPSPQDRGNVKVQFKYNSSLEQLKMSSTPVNRFVSKSITAEDLVKYIDEGFNLRLVSRPASWTGTQLSTAIALGNDDHRVPFNGSQLFQLDRYPKDADGVVTCVVSIHGRIPAYEQAIVIRAPNSSSSSRSQSPAAGPSSIQPAASSEVTENVDTQASLGRVDSVVQSMQHGAPAVSNVNTNRDVEMHDVIEVSNTRLPPAQQPARAAEQEIQRQTHQSVNRRLLVRVSYAGIGWSWEMIIRIVSNATYDDMTSAFYQHVLYPVTPKYLEDFATFSSRTGTDQAGYEDAVRGKVLSEYPGSDEQVMVADITAWLMTGSWKNLNLPVPTAISELPAPLKVCKWFLELAANEGHKTKAEIQCEYDEIKKKTDRLISKHAGEYAEAYGDLVNGVRRRVLQNAQS